MEGGDQAGVMRKGEAGRQLGAGKTGVAATGDRKVQGCLGAGEGEGVERYEASGTR